MFRIILALTILLAGFAGCSDAPAAKGLKMAEAPKQPAPAPTTPMTKENRARLAEQEAVVARLLRSHYGEGASLRHSKDDLLLLQRMIDDRILRRDQTYELQSMGIVLGNVFVNETPLQWVMVDDEHGRDPALQYPNTTVIIFPLTMISKRVEDGREVHVAQIFEVIRKQVEKLKDNPEYRR